jgi:hypothetical protein
MRTKSPSTWPTVTSTRAVRPIRIPPRRAHADEAHRRRWRQRRSTERLPDSRPGSRPDLPCWPTRAAAGDRDAARLHRDGVAALQPLQTTTDTTSPAPSRSPSPQFWGPASTASADARRLLGNYLVSRVDVLLMSWRFARHLSDMAGQLTASGLGIVSLPHLARHCDDTPPCNANWAASPTASPLTFPILGILTDTAEPGVLFIGDQWAAAAGPCCCARSPPRRPSPRSAARPCPPGSAPVSPRCSAGSPSRCWRPPSSGAVAHGGALPF